MRREKLTFPVFGEERADDVHLSALDTRVAEHVLTLRVPGDRVGVGLLELQLLGVDVVHLQGGVLVHHGQQLPAGGEVQAPDGRVDGEDDHREGVVDEYLEYLTVLQTQEQSLPLRRTAHHLDVSDQRLHHPLPLLLAHEVEAGEPLLLAEDEVVGADHQQVHLLVDLLLHPVVHIGQVAAVELVDDDPLGQLDGQPVLVDGDLLDEVPALDPHLLLGEKVLDDDVRHVLPVGVPLPVETVHGVTASTSTSHPGKQQISIKISVQFIL